MRRVIGLDIGGTKCAVVLAQVTDHIEICDRQVIASDPRRSFEQTKNILFETFLSNLIDTVVNLITETLFENTNKGKRKPQTLN